MLDLTTELGSVANVAGRQSRLQRLVGAGSAVLAEAMPAEHEDFERYMGVSGGAVQGAMVYGRPAERAFLVPTALVDRVVRVEPDVTGTFFQASSYEVNQYQQVTALFEAVRSYFQVKQAEVFSDEQAHELLVALYNAKEAGKALTYEELGLKNEARGVAKLAAAGFCELGERNVKITKTGEQFIQAILSK